MVDYVVTLVHGTFAHGADWIQDKASLPSELRRLGEGRLLTFPFEWTGTNTNDARVTAGRDLSKFLLDKAKQYPTAQQVIIAHSHGGNIAFYAARASPIPRLKIVTLGTPFIQANPRSIGPLVEMFDYAGKVVFYVLFVIVAYIVVVFLIVMNNDATLPMGGTANEYVGVFVACLFCFILMLWFRFRIVENKLLPWAARRQRWLVKELTATVRSQHRVFVASVKGDEAMHALSALDLFAESPYAIISVLAALSQTMAIISNAVRLFIPGIRAAAFFFRYSLFLLFSLLFLLRWFLLHVLFFRSRYFCSASFVELAIGMTRCRTTPFRASSSHGGPSSLGNRPNTPFGAKCIYLNRLFAL
jgi:Alpha/beta hydrolase family